MANFEMRVTEYMSSPVETIRIGQSLVAANALFSEQGVSALGVINDAGELKGVVSRTDLLHAAVFAQGETFRVPDRPVEEIMKSPALQLPPLGGHRCGGGRGRHAHDPVPHRQLQAPDQRRG